MDFVLADQTAVYRCVSWEPHIELLQQDSTYTITNAVLKSFNGQKHVSIGQNCQITQIDDMQEVIDNEVTAPGTGQAKVFKDVANVVSIDTYKHCLNCNAKVLLTDSDAVIAICSKCSSTMKVAKCATHNVASVMLQDDQNKLHRVTIFNDILEQIIRYSKQDGTATLANQLLLALELTYTISHKDIVSSVSN